jgi:hypothetical protein
MTPLETKQGQESQTEIESGMLSISFGLLYEIVFFIRFRVRLEKWVFRLPN